LRVGQSYPNFYISRLASKFVKVILTGAGGDEIFAGYPWRYYRSAEAASTAQYVDSYYQYWQRLIPDDMKQSFFQEHIYTGIKDYSTKDIFNRVLNGKAQNVSTPEEYVNASLYFEIKTFLHGLLEVEDKLSMANGLETRTPFLDNDLVDFAMRIPVRYNLKNIGAVERINENEPGKQKVYFSRTNDGKLLLRKALSSYVPENYAGGVKQGFSAPDASWFKGESIEYIRELLFNPKAQIYDYIQIQAAQQLLNEHFAGKVNHRLLIWSLLCFEWWLRIFLK
nr:asparagine synthase C-terminal domain-containing protein [Deltaproteobacteria bacterium]